MIQALLLFSFIISIDDRDIEKPTALEKGASRFYELGVRNLDYVCIGGTAPADFYKIKMHDKPCDQTLRSLVRNLIFF